VRHRSVLAEFPALGGWTAAGVVHGRPGRMSKDAFGAAEEEPAQRAMQKGPKKFFKLTFIVFGDRDEIEPILGIASGLKKAGHDVLFITHHSYKGLVEMWGIRFGPGNPYAPQQQYSTEYSSMIMAGQSGDLMLSKMIHLNNNFKLIEEATPPCLLLRPPGFSAPTPRGHCSQHCRRGAADVWRVWLTFGGLGRRR